MTPADVEALLRAALERAIAKMRERHWITKMPTNVVADLLHSAVPELARAVAEAWEREQAQLTPPIFAGAMMVLKEESERQHDRADAAEARVKELERSIIGHFQREHLEGDGPDIDRWKARLRVLTVVCEAVATDKGCAHAEDARAALAAGKRSQGNADKSQL